MRVYCLELLGAQITKQKSTSHGGFITGTQRPWIFFPKNFIRELVNKKNQNFQKWPIVGTKAQNQLKTTDFYEILIFKHFLGPFFRIFKLTHAKPLCLDISTLPLQFKQKDPSFKEKIWFREKFRFDQLLTCLPRCMLATWWQQSQTFPEDRRQLWNCPCPPSGTWSRPCTCIGPPQKIWGLWNRLVPG